MKKNQKGFTLIEVICSVALLAIIVTASASFFKNVAVSQADSEDRLYANNIAQEVMEEVIRTGDLTKDYTTSYGKGEYTVEVTSKPNASTIGGNGKDLNGDGVVDQTDRDLAATMYPDRPTTTKIPITYEATNVPDVGSTKKPAGTSPPIEDYNGEAFNIHLDMVDFIDADLEMLIAAGKILKSKSDAPYSKEDIIDILNTHHDFEKFKNGASAGNKDGEVAATNIEKAAVFYRYLPSSSINGVITYLQGKSDTIMNTIKNSFNKNTLVSNASYLIGAEAAAKLSDEIMNAYNPISVVTDLYGNKDKICSSCDSSGNLKNTGYKSLDGLNKNNVYNMLNSWMFQNPYNYIAKSFVGSTNNGPSLIAKFLDNNDNFMTYTFREYTNKVDDYNGTSDVYDGYGNKKEDSHERPNIRFQLYGHYLNLYTFNNVNGGLFQGGQIKWNNPGGINSSIPTVTAPLGIKLVNLPYEKPAAQAVADGKTEGWYFYGNVLHQFAFYVTGGMSYLPAKVTADFYAYSGADYYYDIETDSRLPYSPRIDYYKNIDYGKDLYEFKLCNPSGWANFNERASYDPTGETENTGKGPSGGPGTDGNGGTVDTDHGVQREKVTLWLELNVDQTDLYTVRIKNKKGVVISELLCDGNQAVFKAV